MKLINSAEPQRGHFIVTLVKVPLFSFHVGRVCPSQVQGLSSGIIVFLVLLRVASLLIVRDHETHNQESDIGLTA